MIKKILNLLPDQQRKQLMCAFEQCVDQLIELDDSKFLAVNIIESDDYIIEEVAGAFSYGRIVK